MAGSSGRALFESGQVDLSLSAWTKGAPPSEWPKLEGELTADVAIVGAGLAGSSLALHLTELGTRVSVVEAHEPGWGASGRNAGHVVPFRDAEKAFTKLPDAGEAFHELLREGGGIPYELARKHQIDCDAVQGGYMQVAHRRALLPAAERKAEKWAKRGYPVRFADQAEVERRTGTRSYCGATVCETGGRMNPFLFTRGMVAAAENLGARFFAHSPAESIKKEGGRWRVATLDGFVSAERVVVCTNGYTGQLVPELARAWCPLTVFCVTSKPIPDALRNSILPDDAVISQFPTGSHPTLIDGHGRFVTSLLPSPIRPEASGPAFAWFLRWLHRMFPQSREHEIELEDYWTGSTAWSIDTLPRIFEVGPGLTALTCFSGEGNVLAPLLGKHLAEGLATDALDRLALPLQKPEVPTWRGQYDWPLRKLAIPMMKLAERVRFY